MLRSSINSQLVLKSSTKTVFAFVPIVPRYIFLFDKVVIVCKRKGYNYELKEIIELQYYKMSDDPTNNRDMKKVATLHISSRVKKKKKDK